MYRVIHKHVTLSRRLIHTKSALKHQLDHISEMQHRLKKKRRIADKMNMLREEYGEMLPLLKLIYDPTRRFHVTSTLLHKYHSSRDIRNGGNIVFEATNSLEDLLNALTARELTGNAALEAVNSLIRAYPEHQDLIYKIIDKNLHIRLGHKQITKLLAGEDDEELFHVALARPLESLSKRSRELMFQKHVYFASRKLDGIRCLIRVQPKKCDFEWRTRLNRPFPSRFAHLERALARLVPRLNAPNSESFYLDGELCVFAEEDELKEDDFGRVSSSIMKKRDEEDEILLRVQLVLFDIIPEIDFRSGEGVTLFKHRIAQLNQLCDPSTKPKAGLLPSVEPGVWVTAQTPAESEQTLSRLAAESASRNWEGLMLRQDTGWIGRRSATLFKVKKFQDAEYVVEGITTGPMNIVDPDTKQPRQVNVMTSIEILHQGNKVSVGSGFDLETRIKCAMDPSLIVGKEVTVKYFQESKSIGDPNSKSLRFPTIKAIHWSGRRDA